MFLVFCVITFEQIEIKTCQASQNDRLNFSFVKDIHVAGKKWPDMVLKWSLISYYFLGVHQTRKWPQARSWAIPLEPIKI